jgi:hypothetical protein
VAAHPSRYMRLLSNIKMQCTSFILCMHSPVFSIFTAPPSCRLSSEFRDKNKWKETK